MSSALNKNYPYVISLVSYLGGEYTAVYEALAYIWQILQSRADASVKN